jgi:hypothetical protein
VKKISLALAVAAIATMAVVSSASAGVERSGVERYQTQSMTITAVQPKDAVGQWNDIWTHTFSVALNPCDNTFSGSGTFVGSGGVSGSDETITGTLNGDRTISFTVTRPSSGLVFSLTNAPLDGTTVSYATSNPSVSWPLEFHVTNTMGAFSNYKNHGDYVSSQGGGSNAAHSCIGMPVN